MLVRVIEQVFGYPMIKVWVLEVEDSEHWLPSDAITEHEEAFPTIDFVHSNDYNNIIIVTDFQIDSTGIPPLRM